MGGADDIVDRAARADTHDLNQPLLRFDPVDDAKRTDVVFPQPFQFPLQRLARVRIFIQNSEGLFGVTLDGGWQVYKHVSHMWRDADAVANHRELNHAECRGVSGSLKTSSKDLPRPPLAK